MPVRLGWRGGLRGRPVHLPDRSHEAIAAAHDIDDVAGARLAVAQRLAQRRDMDPKIGVVDHDARPHAIQQLLLGHRLAGPLQQRQQKIHRAAAEAALLVALEQKAALRE